MDNDQGHRYGNFPNYYSFHPPQNRLRILEQTNILKFIRNGLQIQSSDADFRGKSIVDNNNERETNSLASDAAGGNVESIKKKPRIEEYKPMQSARTIYYCDLGCNEGDLTMAMAQSLTAPQIAVTPIIDADAFENKPVNVEPHPENQSNPKFVGLDQSNMAIECLGLDLDSMLIERANDKFSSSTKPTGCKSEGSKVESPKLAANCDMKPMFKTCDLCSESEHNSACKSFIDAMRNKVAKTKTIEEDANSKEFKPKPIFHLTSIFSTTMWIHVHAGDEGLRDFLKRACNWTERFLLIEPQPSGCYRKANMRLRKMGRTELNDVTSSRLKMRPEIEQEIEKVILGCGFRRVALSEMNDDKKQDAVTSW
eukprot:CAMPEP_0183732884 /NCGR_PEP_ID=MMETSP0737-20130205/39614_1 /TAXON_ID=385413 /ORGANISM="Thalassiosira miniscula, Strain CCMP1093" /LENGTH=367 /DNA_ID=CAMNT_0025966013 /DNA_START=34 /DNA_END=1134 /DNA_ORIENTATION=-